MVKVELELVGKPPGDTPFTGCKTVQLHSLPRIREYLVLGDKYYEVDRIFYWEGDRPPRIVIRYAGYFRTQE